MLVVPAAHQKKKGGKRPDLALGMVQPVTHRMQHLAHTLATAESGSSKQSRRQEKSDLIPALPATYISP